MKEKYIPKKVIENGVEYVLFDNMFRAEETINYATTHNFPIKFICTTYTSACEVLAEIQESGYVLDFKKVPVYVEGMKLNDNIEVICSK